MRMFASNIPAVVALVCAEVAAAQDCQWAALGHGTNEGVSALATYDDGHGEALYVGGDFDVVDRTLIVNHVAKWDGRSWASLGDGLRSGLVFDFAVFDDGAGAALYAAGSFETSGGKPVRCVARWNGLAWSQVGTGAWPAPSSKPTVHALCVHDDGTGPALYAGGWFSSVDGVPSTYCIARWDGKSWSSVGGGVGSRVRALAVFDDGAGPALYAAGYLQTAGGTPANHVAKWDGESWSALGEGTDRYINALAAFNDGGGPALYAGGTFTMAGGAPVGYLAKWDGSSWSEVGGGMDKFVSGLATLDDGSGAALYVGGAFTMAGGQPIHDPVKWDGRRWTELHGGESGLIALSASVYTIFDDGLGPALYAGGAFEEEPGWWQLGFRQYIARGRCDHPPPCPADCDASGALDFFDFLCFQNRFGAADPRADCDGSTVLDFFDFLCFQNAFAAGCP